MSDRYFDLRLSSSYENPDNTVDRLDVEVLDEGEWQKLDLDARSPGFLLFIYGLFACQHLYFRTNAAERGLMLASSQANLKVVTDETWHISSLHVTFRGQLRSGTVTQEAHDYIVDRMGHCPVSSNVRDIDDRSVEVSFDED